MLFVDHKRLYPTAGDMPADEVLVPLGRARVCRAGRHVTLVAHAYMVRMALAAAEALAGEGVDCEVIDLRSLAPLDVDTVATAVARTGALVTIEEGQATCGVGAEVAARVREALPGQPLRIARVAALPAPVSSNPVFEAACVPDAPRVAAAVRALLS